MTSNFEIKYLDLKWYDKNTLTKVIESMNALHLEYDQERELFTAETTIYPRLSNIEMGQLGIRFLNEKDDTTPPYIEMPNGEKKHLDPIKDFNTGITWWILKDKWVSNKKYWLGIASNIVGTINFFIHNKRCEISINGFDFTREELEQYLQSFKNDLWELILDENSFIGEKVKESQKIGVSEDIIDCINSLVTHSFNILNMPKVELREIQALKSRKAVKPVNRTFMELATKINQRFLTSRATESSYNIAENRYILFVLERCYHIIKQIVILTQNKSRRFQNTVEKLQNHYNDFTNTIKVDRDLVYADLQKIRERTKLEYWQKKLNGKIEKHKIKFHPEPCSSDFYFRVENYTKEQNTNKKDGLFIFEWDGNEWVKPDGKSCILKFLDRLNLDILYVFEPGMDFKINCNYTKESKSRSVLFKIGAIHSIELIGANVIINNAINEFKKEKNIGIKLAENNWVKTLSKLEIDEQEKEKIALRNRIQFYKQEQMLCSYIYKKIEPKSRAIKKLIKNYKMLNIKPSSDFPNSMTFVYNPHYQGVHSAYKTLQNITNLSDENILMSLEEIDQIGLINMPILYERWTLIQIIFVLKEKFRFKLLNNWKYQIIDAIKTNRKDIEINLLNESAKRSISLCYEKTLFSGKRPDFVLDLKWFASDSDNEQPKSQRFVLDAKFYDKSTFNKLGGMMGVLNTLYKDKDYSENGNNPVFIIHPCPNLIENRVTSQKWGEYSFLGELDIMYDQQFYSHNIGAIFLNPIDNVLYHDELQRLLGMFIQYKLESSSTNDEKNDLTNAVPICIRCGADRFTNLYKSDGYYNNRGEWVKRTSRSVWIKCEECEQIQSYNHCYNCRDGTRIIKNGLEWSYHSARSIEPFNIKCPTCGNWGNWDINKQKFNLE